MTRPDIRSLFFRYRSYTPIPFLLVLLLFAAPTPWSLGSGLAVVVAGEMLRLWAVSYAGGKTRRTDHADADSLIISGPFAFLRNPLYAGNFLIYTGFVIMGWALMPWFMLVFWLFIAVQYWMIISLEEQALREKFGAAYVAYCVQVPRLIPRRRAFRAGSQRPRPLGDVLRIEHKTLINLAVITLVLFVLWSV